MGKVYMSSKWWEVKGWGESVSTVCVCGENIPGTVYSTV